MTTMRYLLLIYGNEADAAGRPESEQHSEYAAYHAFTEEIKAANVYKSGEALHPTSTATTVRVRDGKLLTTDGPFAETKEQLLGFYLVDCDGLDGALDVARDLAKANPGAGSYEIRPVGIYHPEGARIPENAGT